LFAAAWQLPLAHACAACRHALPIPSDAATLFGSNATPTGDKAGSRDMALRSVIDANVRLSRASEKRWRLQTDKTLWARFEQEAEDSIRGLPDGAVALDVGGGRRCVYARSVDPPGRVRLIAVDISAAELAENRDVAETCLADIAGDLPIESGSVDLVLSRALLEHVADVPAAIRNMARVLKPEGTALHLVPCRYSLYGMAARLLPFGPLLKLTHFVMPWTRGHVEFPVVYDHCYPRALEHEFRSAGFRHVEVWITWAQPGYFEAVYPLFLLHAIYEWTVRRLGLRQLAAFAVVRATR
jgi:SAM-dependent methyltransferase